MRVLQLVTRDEPGGVQVLAAMVGAGLAERGMMVETMALAGGVRAIAVAIWGGRYDAILSYQVAAGLMGGLLGALAGVPVRAAHLTALPNAMRPHWRWLDRVWGRWGLHTAIIANSMATVASVSRYPRAYRDRVRLIVHGVPALRPALADWRQRLGLAPGVPLLVCSGRLTAQKDHATVLAALARLPTGHLVIAGEGELRPALLAQAEVLGIAGRLRLVGTVPRAQLGGLLAAADVYLFPSVWESFGLACVEAAMVGVPVIASDLPVLREVLALAAVCGQAQFHAPGNIGALADAVGECLARPHDEPRRKASAAAMRARFGVGPMIDAYCDLLGVR